MSSGQNSVIWSARPVAVWLGLRAQAHVVAAVFASPCIVAVMEAEEWLAATLGLGVALPLLAALAARRGTRPPALRDIEGVAILVALFVGTAVLSVPAFMALGLAPLDALFEGVSAITSTGLTVATGTMDWPLAGHLLRGWMQWAGGFAIAVAGVALLLGPGGSAPRGATKTLGEASLSDRDLLQSTRAQARALLIVYAGLTLLAVAVLMPLLPTWWEAVAVALAAVSTGGFTPRPDSLASYSAAAQIATLLLCVATAFSLLFYVVLRRSGLRAALTTTNVGVVLAVFAVGLATTAGLAHLAGSDLAGMGAAALNFLSGATTAGFSVSDVSNVPSVAALTLAGMVVGGGIGSTAGGIKADRLWVFARTVALSATRMRAPPRAVTVLAEGGQQVSADRLMGMVAVVLLYFGTLLVGWLIFLSAGSPPLPALFDVVSALSTAGLSTGVSGPDLAAGLKAVLIAAMLLGRLEFLALIVVLSPATWAAHPTRRLN